MDLFTNCPTFTDHVHMKYNLQNVQDQYLFTMLTPRVNKVSLLGLSPQIYDDFIKDRVGIIEDRFEDYLIDREEKMNGTGEDGNSFLKQTALLFIDKQEVYKCRIKKV